MKKLFAIVAILFATMSVAHADSVTVEAAHINHKSNSITIIPSVDAFGLTFDARVQAVRSLSNITSNELELRVGKSFTIAPALTASVKVGAGKNFGGSTVTSTTRTVRLDQFRLHPEYVYTNVQTPVDYVYYSIEPSLKYKLSDVVALKLSDRYTHTIENQDKYAARHEFGIAAEYAVTKNDIVGVKFVHQHGTSNGNGVKLAYTRSF